MTEDILNSFSQDKLVECLNKQLSELEIFQTMYSPNEIVITNTEVIEQIRNYVEKNTVYQPNHLDYTIIQQVENLKLEISVHLPTMYPEIAPEVHVRCNQLNRHQETSLNADLTAYLQTQHDDEVCIFNAILWLQDHVERYINNDPIIDTKTDPETLQHFSRYWIYSHHIYSKKKTDEITKLSKELHLNGFCLLGKPGVICVEGSEDDCKEGWKIIKALHWQKIALRITETFNYDEKPKQMKFKNFDIITLDLGSFQKYVQNFGLLDQINEFFGVHTS